MPGQLRAEVGKRFLPAVAILGLVGLGIAVACISLYVRYFPFRREEVVRQFVSHTGAARVEIGSFRQTWSPPGFVASHINALGRKGDTLTIERIVVEGSYSGMIGAVKSLTVVHADGVHLTLPQPGNGVTWKDRTLLTGFGAKPGVEVGEIRIRNGVLDLLSHKQGEPPLTFLFHELTLEHVSAVKPVGFRISMRNPVPSGDVRSTGNFGPWIENNVAQTPVSGQFTYSNANLYIPHAISGILGASGKYHGSFNNIAVEGTADVPHFQVAGSTHPVHIATAFQASVDARNGDINLRRGVAHFNSTTISATGHAAGSPNRAGKTVTIDLSIRDGRVEDVLSLFTKRPQPAMDGPVRLTGKFTIPPGPPDFLTRLMMDGEFEIPRGRFASQKAQVPIDRLSASSQGTPKRVIFADPVLVDTMIRASVSDRNGVASLRNVVFDAPGIHGLLAGTFTLHERGINLSGTLQTTGKLSDTTTGMKSFALKALGLFSGHHSSGRTYPIHIGGRTSHPIFTMKTH